MARHEFPIDMARRHVREAQARVERQRVIVRSLASRKMPVEAAIGLLLQFEAVLADHRRQLERIGREQRLGLRDDEGVVVGMRPALQRNLIDPSERDGASWSVRDPGQVALADRNPA